MEMADIALALDCGTHAVRVLAFDVVTGVSTNCASRDIPLSFPRAGWVEVDPKVLADAAIGVICEALKWAESGGHRVLALGIANMRETAFAWRRSTGEPLYPGVMWMSQQSEQVVRRWHQEGLDPLIRERTGLSNEAFFFGSKVAWMLETQHNVKAAAAEGDLAVGTVDSWLINQLTGGMVHRTDFSNGSRTQLMNLEGRVWDPELCRALGIPMSCLPELTATAGYYGVTDGSLCGGSVPITGVIADQQASLLGHGCEEPGDSKVTFGTSGVVSINTGRETPMRPGVVTSVGWAAKDTGVIAYQIEGSAFHSAYTLGWLSERTGQPVELPNLEAARGNAEDRVYVLPSFTTLGAPRWPKRRGAAITGLAMDTTTADIMRAGLEAMAYQAFDLFQAMEGVVAPASEVNVDGGGASSDYLCQFFANLLQREVVRPELRELTCVGAAKAAIRGAGISVGRHFGQDRTAADRFTPEADGGYARDGYDHWVKLVETILR